MRMYAVTTSIDLLDAVRPGRSARGHGCGAAVLNPRSRPSPGRRWAHGTRASRACQGLIRSILLAACGIPAARRRDYPSWRRSRDSRPMVEVHTAMSTRRYRSRRHEDWDAARHLAQPVRKLELRRRQLDEHDAESDTLEFLEEYDATGHHLRLERFPR